MGYFCLVGRAPGQLDQPRIDFDPDAAGAIFLRGNDRNAPVAGSEIVYDIGCGHAGEPQHGVGDVVPRRCEVNVGGAGRLGHEEPQRQQRLGEHGEG